MLTLVVCGAVLYFSWRGKRTGKIPFVRKIAGLDAIDEAVGRAAEMGRPVFWTSGWAGAGTRLYSTSGPALVASVSILNYVSRLAAQKDAKVIAAICGSEMLPVVEEAMRMGYVAEGKADKYRPENIYYFPEQSYTIATVSLMKREQIASGVYAGPFGHDAIILGETGYLLKALTVAASTGNLPFLLATCDYVLIGEELLAAGAYLSKDSVSLGGILGEDLGKIIELSLLAIGVALVSAGSKLMLDLLGF